MSVGTKIMHVQGPISSSGAPGGGDSLTFVFCGLGYGHFPAHTAQYFDSCIGGAPGQVPAECFLGGTSAWQLTSPRRVSFSSDVTVLGGAQAPVHSPDIVLSELSRHH